MTGEQIQATLELLRPAALRRAGRSRIRRRFLAGSAATFGVAAPVWAAVAGGPPALVCVVPLIACCAAVACNSSTLSRSPLKVRVAADVADQVKALFDEDSRGRAALIARCLDVHDVVAKLLPTNALSAAADQPAQMQSWLYSEWPEADRRAALEVLADDDAWDRLERLVAEVGSQCSLDGPWIVSDLEAAGVYRTSGAEELTYVFARAHHLAVRAGRDAVLVAERAGGDLAALEVARVLAEELYPRTDEAITKLADVAALTTSGPWRAGVPVDRIESYCTV